MKKFIFYIRLAQELAKLGYWSVKLYILAEPYLSLIFNYVTKNAKFYFKNTSRRQQVCL